MAKGVIKVGFHFFMCTLARLRGEARGHKGRLADWSIAEPVGGGEDQSIHRMGGNKSPPEEERESHNTPKTLVIGQVKVICGIYRRVASSSSSI